MAAVTPWIGGLILIGTVYGIVKRWETRMVLFGAGLLMAIVGMKPVSAFQGFEKAMTNAGLISAILSVMGFAYVMKLTKCDLHMVNFLARLVSRARWALIPGAIWATWLSNIALPSAAGVSAAVGAVLIPVMISAGIHPAVAAAAILLGTYGSSINPGQPHTAYIAKLAKADVMTVVPAMTKLAVAGGIVSAIVLLAYAYFTKEDRGYVAEPGVAPAQGVETFKVNYLMAIVPVLPLALIFVGAQPAFKNWGMNVPASMLIGAMVAILVSRTSPAEVTRSFFDGMGKAYGDIMGIIIAAGVFTAGLTSVGLIDKLMASMKGASGAVGLVAAIGPTAIAVLTGSGDAATFAFNDAVTVHAAQFGWTIPSLGALAANAAAFGRAMSPVAGATLVVAGIAGIKNPLEIVKRTALPMILATIVAYFLVA